MDLFTNLASRDPGALGALYDRYGKILYSLASRIIRDGSECEEIVQDVFLALWKNPSLYRPERSSPLTFLTSITRNKCIDRLRKAGRRLPTAPGSSDFADLVADDRASDPYRSAELDDLSAQVRNCLGALPEPQRITVESSYFEGLGPEEIAARFELPTATVKSRLRLALDKLRRCLRRSPIA
jgi:RNA polymerase sigma-70 factor, ECF subfamily